MSDRSFPSGSIHLQSPSGENREEQADAGMDSRPVVSASVIVCSRDRPDLLFELVQSILAGDALPAEIVIVDDSDSQNERLMQLKSGAPCDIRYFWSHKVGLSRANNEGIAEARYDLIIFTQDDVLVASDWLKNLVQAAHEEGPNAVITGQVPPLEENEPGHFAPSTYADGERRVYQDPTPRGVLYVQNMALYRSVFETVGPFDERIGPGTEFPAGEDIDYLYRILKAGYRVVYRPEPVVYHRAWRSEGDYGRLRYNYGLARGAAYAKHMSSRDREVLSFMLWDIRVHLLAAVGQLRQQRLQAKGNFLLAFGIVSGAGRWFIREKGMKGGRS